MPKQRRNVDWNIVDGPAKFSPSEEDWVGAERLLGLEIDPTHRDSFLSIYQSYLREKNLENAAEPLASAYAALQGLSEMFGAVDVGNAEALRIFKSHLAQVRLEVDLAPPSDTAVLGFDSEPREPRMVWISPGMLYHLIYHLRAAAAGALSEVVAKMNDEDRPRDHVRRPFARGAALEQLILDATDWSDGLGVPATASNSTDRPFPKFLYYMLKLAPTQLREPRLASVGSLSKRVLDVQKTRRWQLASGK